MAMIKIGVIGGAGYTGGELLRILLHHPEAELAFVHSKSNAGNPLYAVHGDLIGVTERKFDSSFHAEVDLLFLCMGHGDSRKFLDENPELKQCKIIDLSQDYRIQPDTEDFVYGLPEQYKTEIQQATHIANPGCFATAMQLALLPLASEGLLKEAVHISGTTGSTGAGQKLSPTSHFSWRNDNLSHYKLFTHQHLREVKQMVKSNGQDAPPIFFVPYRGAFTRGILVTAYTPTLLEEPALVQLYTDFYRKAAFTHVSTADIHLKQVVNTNKCVVHVQKKEGQAVITAAIDNLQKGASGQAVQNMNLMFGLEETTGLHFKANAF